MSAEPILSNKKLLQVLSLSPLATAIYTGPEITIQSINKAMLALWGKDESVVGKTFEQAIPEIVGQPFPELLKTVWVTGESYEDTDASADLVINGKLQTSYFDFKYEAIKNDTGEMECILHTATDVTERFINRRKLKEHQEIAAQKQTTSDEQVFINEELLVTQNKLLDLNEELMTSESRLRSLIEQIPTAINVFKTHDLIVDLPNERMLEIWGRTEAEVLNKPLLVAMPELTGQSFLQRLADVLNTGKAYYSSDEKAFIKRKGKIEECYFNIVYQPVVNTDGSITSILQICTEVTKEVLANRQVVNLNKELTAINAELSDANEDLQEAQDNYVDVYNKLLQNQKDLLFTIDAAGMGTFDLDLITNRFVINDLLASWSGLVSTEEVGLEAAVGTVADYDQERLMNAMLEASRFSTGGGLDVEYTIINADNPAPRTVRARGQMFFSEDGKPARLRGVVQDITEQKKDEQRKNDFISMVSHELKTPLTSMGAYIQILQSRAGRTGDELAAGMLDKANKQVRRMTTLINGFLNVNRLESGKIQIDKQRFDMAILMQEIDEEATATILNHKLIFEPVEETFVMADRDKIAQVINNFISNAAKYSQAGTTIQVACITRHGEAYVSVQDHGMGVAPLDKDKLFDRFYRAENSKTGTIAGFGIGLYLCKEIIDRHQGQIGVDSRLLSKGSTFWFTLPVMDESK